MKKEELELVTHDGKTVTIDKLLSNISKVENAVQQTAQKYKTIMEDVFLLHKSKVHKEQGYSNFYDFLKDKTGMSKSTAARLIQCYRTRLEIMSTISIETDANSEEIKEIADFFDNATMETYASMTQDQSPALNAITDYLTNKSEESLKDKVENSYEAPEINQVSRETSEKTDKKQITIIYNGKLEKIKDNLASCLPENCTNYFIKIWEEK